MEPVKLLALDLDGTLLNSKKELTPRTRAALYAAAEAGVEIVPTTGRFFGAMPEAIRTLPFLHYAITVNGAQVYDRVADAAIVREEIPLETAVAVMRLLDGYDVIYDCSRANWGWMGAAFKEKAAAYATDEHYLAMVRDFRREVPELKAHLAATAAEGDVQKIMLFARLDGPADATAQVAEAVRARFPEIAVTSTTWNNLELNIASANKGVALARLAAHLGLSSANCIAFGDGRNDLTMIEAAGVGVAMANAHPDVRAAADDVTLSNDEDGVAAALVRYGLA